jgi:Domain of unknown function (DUF4168)
MPARKLWSKSPFFLASIAGPLVGVAAILAASVASAQAPSPSPSQPGVTTPAAPNLSDQKIGAAATAMQHVATLRQNYQQQIAEAPVDQQDRIATEANAALTKAVTDQGLSVQEYNAILTAAQQDPKVRDQLVQHMHPSGP